MTPMIQCAQTVASTLLSAAGRPPSIFAPDDDLSTWCREAFTLVDTPANRRPPPAEWMAISRKIEAGKGDRADVLTMRAASLAVAVWRIVDDVLDAHDAEGDGSPAEHDAERTGRLATWETIGKPVAVQRIEMALAEMIPRVVSGVMTGATS